MGRWIRVVLWDKLVRAGIAGLVLWLIYGAPSWVRILLGIALLGTLIYARQWGY